jgi:hypothetical protein
VSALQIVCACALSTWVCVYWRYRSTQAPVGEAVVHASVWAGLWPIYAVSLIVEAIRD